MKRDMENLNLQDAFKPTPDKCRDALMTAARSVKEEEPVKRATVRTILIAACIILATTVIAIAATNSFGWKDFFEINYGDTGTVPEAALEIMNNTEEQTFAMGPLTCTVTSLFADPHIAMLSTRVTVTDGSPALICMYGEWMCPIGGNCDNGEAVAEKYGLDPEMSWLDAARKLNLPLYSIDTRLSFDDAFIGGEGMFGATYDRDGRYMEFSMQELNSTKVNGTLPARMFMECEEVDLATGESREVMYGHVDLPIPVTSSEKMISYRPAEDYTAFGLHLDGVHAEKTAGGLYLSVELTAQTGSTPDQSLRFQLYPSWFDENGKEYPDGMDYGFGFNMDEWPHVRMDGMIASDSIPDRIWLQLVDDNARPEDEPAPKIELKRIKP